MHTQRYLAHLANPLESVPKDVFAVLEPEDP